MKTIEHKIPPIGKYLQHQYTMTDAEVEKHTQYVLDRLEKIAKPYMDKTYKRERVLAVAFSPEPVHRGRDIDPIRDHKIILDYKTEYSLADDKKKFPSIFDNEFVFGIKTNKRILLGRIYARYKWNHADIVGPVQLIAMCSKDDRRVILGSGLHDFLLEYKHDLYNQFIKDDPELTIAQYRWITSDAFRWVINSQGMGPVKSKVMSNVVDYFQKHWQKKKWDIEIDEW